MATLADLFNEKSQDIYKRFSAKKEPSDQPYISIRPDTDDARSRIKDDNRSLPFVSKARDTQRVSKFLRSSDGVLFLAKQALLQTGNTFENTKVINPAEFLLNATPFLHIRRHLGVLDRTSGLLQIGTVTSISSKFTIAGTINEGIRTRGLGRTVRSLAATYLSNQVGALTAQLKSTIDVSQINTQGDTSRPEFSVFKKNGTYMGPVLFPPQPISQRSLPRLNATATFKALTKTAAKIALRNAAVKTVQKISFGKLLKNTKSLPLIQTIQEQKQQFSFAEEALSFKQKFFEKNNNAARTFNFSDRDTNGTKSSNNLPQTNASVRLNNKFFSERLLSDSFVGTDPTKVAIDKGDTELKDPYNILRQGPNGVQLGAVYGTSDVNKLNYYGIIGEQEQTDIVRFAFSNLNGETVQFRALISSIKESVKPEFTEQRYVGRTERFVVYGGAKRSVSLNFNIVAFSQEEQYGMWQRVNYLSGLAFPQDVKNGFMVPPLFKITVGGLYDGQPCYLENLDYDFLDEAITFDVDRQVPHSVAVNMQLSILEKRSKFYDSPFYKIAEDMAQEQFALRNPGR
jgi:hypothetical protein